IEFVAAWSPDTLFVMINELDEASQPFAAKTVNSWRQETSTGITTTPYDLVAWGRTHHLTRNVEFGSAMEFRAAVTDVISHAREKILETASQRIYWNQADQSWSPKPEPQVTQALLALLIDQAEIKGIQIIPQAGAGGGNVDFEAVGIVKGQGLCKIVL